MILNTQQMVLLCLLVSFVTSIATGITVVSLMQQAPEPVTATINRVIERTVEIAQQPTEEIKNIITNTKPEKEVVTVVVNQEEQSINAVEKNELSVARLYTKDRNPVYATMGIVLNKEGDVVVDKRLVIKRDTYTARYGDREFTVKYVPDSETTDFVTMRISDENPNDFVPATFGDSNSLRLAQSVISLSGTSQTSVSTGEITSLNKIEDSLISITTTVNPANVLTGSILLNLSGSVIGIRVSNIEDKTVFMPILSFKAQVGVE